MAHSAAGLLLPPLAQRLNAVRQVWLAAVVADYANGRSFAEELSTDPEFVVSGEWLGANVADDPVAAAYFLFHDCDLATLRGALPTVAVSDLSPLYAERPAYNPTTLPSTYLLPTQDRTVRPSWMRLVAQRRLSVDPVEIDAGHNCYAAYPREVAAIIDGQR